MANGFRPDANRPGHHMTILQSLPKTMDLASDRVVVLDALRRKSNLSDYMGEEIDDASPASCQDEAQRLLDDAMEWLAEVQSEGMG